MKVKIFLDECVLQLYTLGSLFLSLRNVLRGHDKKLKYGIKKVDIKNVKQYEKTIKYLEKKKMYSQNTIFDSYEILNNSILKLYERDVKLFVSPYIIEKTLNRIENFLTKNNFETKLISPIIHNYLDLYRKRYGYLYKFNNGYEKPLRLHFVDVITSDSVLKILYFDSIKKPLSEKTRKRNKEFEKATLPDIYLDPADKFHVDAAYYCGCNAFLTIDNRIVKGNCKVHRFLPIITPEDVIEVIKDRKKVKKYAERKCRNKLSKNHKNKRL